MSSQGDLNSTYSVLFYSIANANNFKDSSGTHCPLELVIGGAFPDARYFSITVNDEHNAAAQHLADAGIDPVISESASGSYPLPPAYNPFVVTSGGSSQPYSSAKAYPYLVPNQPWASAWGAPFGQRPGLGRYAGVPDQPLPGGLPAGRNAATPLHRLEYAQFHPLCRESG
jgi:hypothetical protein